MLILAGLAIFLILAYGPGFIQFIETNPYQSASLVVAGFILEWLYYKARASLRHKPHFRR